MGVDSAVVSLLMIVVCSRVDAGTAPSDRQTRELLLLDSLGKKGIMGTADQDTIIDMLGRSMFEWLDLSC